MSDITDAQWLLGILDELEYLQGDDNTEYPTGEAQLTTLDKDFAAIEITYDRSNLEAGPDMARTLRKVAARIESRNGQDDRDDDFELDLDGDYGPIPGDLLEEIDVSITVGEMDNTDSEEE